MKVDQKKWNKFLVAGAALALVTGMASTPPSAYAGGTIKADEDKWISIGMGIRASYNSRENAGAGTTPAFGSYDSSTYDKGSFNVDNARIYINGQVHKYIKFTFNTDCFQCGGGGNPFGTGTNAAFGGSGPQGTQFFGQNSTIGLLDAILKIEYNEKINFWMGRTLLPFDRGELNGPYYHATYNGFRTPFLSADAGTGFNANGSGGLFGRDNGVVFFGKVHPGGTHLLYSFMVSQGVTGGPNSGSNPAFTGRIQWNLLNDEDNPGYYTSGTYYGTAGDILALAMGFHHQHNGAGAGLLNAGGTPVGFVNSDANAIVFDALFEKLIPGNMGVLTINGEFKRYWGSQLASYAAAAPPGGSLSNSGMFNGNSWTIYGLYLMPNKIGWGRFQPYGRFTRISPIDSSQREEWEGGVNYVIDGHNMRFSAYYTYGDINTKGFFSYGGPVAGNRADAFHVALQVQY